MEFKLFDKPDYAAGRPGDAAWYRDREVSDHIHQDGMHRGRLLEALDLVLSLQSTSISDWGAGNGGLLHEIGKARPDVLRWGYDMSPLAVKHAQEIYGERVQLLDVINGAPAAGDLVILTEFLEHIVSPHELLRKLLQHPAAHSLVASSPCNETPADFYEYHLWAWTRGSFAQMFERAGWKVLRHYLRVDVNTQFVLAERP